MLGQRHNEEPYIPPRVDTITREYLIVHGYADEVSSEATDRLNDGWEIVPGSYTATTRIMTLFPPDNILGVQTTDSKHDIEYSQALYRETRS